MNPKMLLLHMSHRLYEDIKFVTAQNPTQIVDDDGTRAYNAVLSKTRKYINAGDFMEDFVDWTPRSIKYKDALIAVGQLYAMIQACVEGTPDYDFSQYAAEGTEDSAPASESPFRKDPPRHLQDPNVIGEDNEYVSPTERKKADEELYGSGEVKRNEDGTIPFSLD